MMVPVLLAVRVHVLAWVCVSVRVLAWWSRSQLLCFCLWALCVHVLLVQVGTTSSLLGASGFLPPHNIDPEGWPLAVGSSRVRT